MGGAVPPLPQYAFIAWCSVGGAQGILQLFAESVYYTHFKNCIVRGRKIRFILYSDPK
jgi:hypothetical protein